MMMKPFVYKEGMTLEEQVNGAYWERNMLAVLIANLSNAYAVAMSDKEDSGWYVHGEWEGWSRVISIANGEFTFHIPDNFDVGKYLPQIEPNWDGHTTEEKWIKVMEVCGMETE